MPRHAPTLTALLLAAALLPAAGCAVGQLIGGMAASAERAGSKIVKPKYEGLEGKTFAVVIAADRGVQADQPDIVPLMSREITRRLSDNCGASGVVPADDVLKFQYQRPGWVAMSPGDLAKELGVERLVFVELQDFALNDPGNVYIWAGSAVATVRVLEADGRLKDDFAFREPLRVGFPDQEGLGPMQIPAETVRAALAKRIIDRVSWLFYEHEEANIIKY
ncbi:MAG: hypothetical protein K2Q20_15630 [Phycisphaerales bacterium]|nr:hypothetical protein [Phycisphaerales bacterium]